MSSSPEIWLKGPLPGIQSLLQPVAHALVQVKEEVKILMNDFDDQLLWIKPAGLASVAFHLQHIAGVQDRLLTYANGKMLTEEQLNYLSNEGKENEHISIASLIQKLDYQIELSLEFLEQTDVSSLTDVRLVGRKQIPSTVIGLLFHAAEHSMRHVGQLLITVKILKAGSF